ncbi:hypothetical protein, partial [Merismopedia glauca]
MIHIITNGLDRPTLTRILLSYLRAWGCNPVSVDASTIAIDDFAAWDNLLTLPCCVLSIYDPHYVLEWLAESQVQFCWYQFMSPQRQEMIDTLSKMERVRIIGGRVFYVLSERLFKGNSETDAIYVPVMGKVEDWLGVISDRATHPTHRQKLVAKLDAVYGMLAS